MNGVLYAGLDYVPFFHELDRLGIKDEEFDQTMSALRIIESEAAQILNPVKKNG